MHELVVVLGILLCAVLLILSSRPPNRIKKPAEKKEQSRELIVPSEKKPPKYQQVYVPFRQPPVKPKTWHRPEVLSGMEERDRKSGRTRFYCYVMKTDSGHYVGHTGRRYMRIRQHEQNEVQSTMGRNPSFVWMSKSMDQRRKAARFEAALKSWRDQRNPRFREIVGENPVPWRETNG